MKLVLMLYEFINNRGFKCWLRKLLGVNIGICFRDEQTVFGPDSRGKSSWAGQKVPHLNMQPVLCPNLRTFGGEGPVGCSQQQRHTDVATQGGLAYINPLQLYSLIAR
jgi:hypothetical protein